MLIAANDAEGIGMDFSDFLRKNEIESDKTLMLRHSPPDKFRTVLRWLASKEPGVFNCYQATQYSKAEAAMAKAAYVASFIGHAPGKALFVGLYKQAGSKLVTDAAFRALKPYQRLVELGHKSDPAKYRRKYQRFDLRPIPDLSEWKGRLIIDWPPPDLGWFKWASKNTFPVHAITQESELVGRIPRWEEVKLRFAELELCPESLRAELRRWRGIYFIYDTEQGKGYVGSAYGDQNIWQRWSMHAKRGGDARKLKQCDPRNLVFTILEITNHKMPADEIFKIESNWKHRLHTIAHGLNVN